MTRPGRWLRAGEIPLDHLRVSQKLSRAPEAYKSPSPAALAARQLQASGVEVSPGLRMQFWFVYGGVKVKDVTLKEVDVPRYKRLVELAVEEVLDGITSKHSYGTDRNLAECPQ
jgi:DNA polymerase elongation subunit (family B)